MLTSLTSTPVSFLYCAISFFQPASCPGTVEIQNVSDFEVPPESDPPPQAESSRAPADATAARGTRRRIPPRPSRLERRTPTVVIFDPFFSWLGDGARRRPRRHGCSLQEQSPSGGAASPGRVVHAGR